jgi:hypothetical protein
MKKLYRKLTIEQRQRNVIFSSCLSVDKHGNGTIHEVLECDSDKLTKIERLKDDKFFNASHYKYNIIRD